MNRCFDVKTVAAALAMCSFGIAAHATARAPGEDLASLVTHAAEATGPATAWEPDRVPDLDTLIAKHPEAAEVIEHAAWFRVSVADPDGNEFDHPALALPLPERGHLVVFRDGQGRLAARLAGDPVFETDPTARWRIIASQMTERMGDATAASLPTPAEREGALEAAVSDERAASLHRLRRLMRESSARFSQTSFADHSVIITDEWIGSWAETFGEIGSLAPTIEGVYGPETAASFESAATIGRERLLAALEAHQAGDTRARNRQIFGVYRASCQACHQTESPEGRRIYTDLNERMAALGARGDLFAVGVDALGVEGADERSQQVLDTGRVAIVLWNETQPE